MTEHQEKTPYESVRLSLGKRTEEFVRICVEEFEVKTSRSDSDSDSEELDVNHLKPTNPPNLENLNLKAKEMSQIDLHPVVLSAVCGTIFGDASLAINKNETNARLQMRHSSRQTDWFMWKSLCVLKELTDTNSICFQKPDGYQRPTIEGETLGKWKVVTKTNSELTKLHSILYKKKTKTFQRHWLNHMNNYFLMILWLNNGSLNEARQGIISLNSTPLDQAQILVGYLTKVWGIQCEAGIVKSKSKKSNPEPVAITISDLDHLEKFVRIVAPIVPVKSMLYKVCIYHADRSCLQRWTSELKTLIKKEWHRDLDKYYAYLDVVSLC